MVQHKASNALRLFIEEWESPKETLTMHTSGSTGVPKPITVRKQQMRASAEMTCRFLGLKRGDTALLCLPTEYIAGKMMVVRSLVSSLHLVSVPPSIHPLLNMDEAIDFAAMIPTQVYHSLHTPCEAERLRNIRCLIIGGSAIDSQTEAALRSFPNPIYATYGMTETVSHIALRRINGKDAHEGFMPMDGVKVSLSSQNTLIIDAPTLCEEPLQTNDCARILDDGSFVLLGRIDNVVNSGGIKHHIEQLEAKLRMTNNHATFAFTSVPHPEWGEALVLLIEEGSSSDIHLEALTTYERPKHILHIHTLPLTANAKIDRKACRTLALAQIKPFQV